MVCLRFAVAVAVSFACMAAVASGLSCYQCSYTEGVPETATNQKKLRQSPLTKPESARLQMWEARTASHAPPQRFNRLPYDRVSPVPYQQRPVGCWPAHTDNCNGKLAHCNHTPTGHQSAFRRHHPRRFSSYRCTVAATTQRKWHCQEPCRRRGRRGCGQSLSELEDLRNVRNA
ncbi:hypothetical protein BV898_16594 [Hypsibius exemplaris]|uniref:Secreted protein n=1 Tax=Hypsibius exemplaris TaxID=2072580 RepID=A0A9X6NG61_HYPEX|nr:hypothetical protein BV898_16594 [Hypsibius exemplaris]